MADLTGDEFAAAKKRGEARLRGPRGESVHFDRERNRIVVRLTTGIEIGLDPGLVEGLQHASADDLAEVGLQEFGLGIHFPRLDADLYVPALLKGLVGSTRWMAAELGAAGGRRRSPAKAAASRDNGRLGGRPRKTVKAD